jgi:uncharacterized protein with gpF-like domain
MRLKKNEKVLRPVHPNAGIAALYRRKLQNLTEEMHRSFSYRLKAAYRANAPAIIAQDAVPAAELQAAINDLTRQWRRRFNDGAPGLAAWFAKVAWRRSDAALKKILRDAGISVEFQMSRAMRDILRATIEQNVGLIKSIPEQYLTQVTGSVMRSVTTGRDLGSLAKELQEHYGVTKRRAAFISLDQNNKASSAFNRVRQLEVGITRAIWMHSHAGKKPRPSHVKNDGKPYDVNRGWFDPHEQKWIFPGELPRCRCTSRSIVKGFS